MQRILKEHAGDTVLVVGHSDTVPEIIDALGAGKVPEIADIEFDNLYIVDRDRTAQGLRGAFEILKIHRRVRRAR